MRGRRKETPRVNESNATHDVEYHQSLLRLIAQGDAQAFAELYALLSKPIAALAYRILGSQEEVEEVLQDAFLAIWNHAASYDPELSRPFSWMVMITRRLCWNRLRSKGRHLRKLEALEVEQSGPVIPEPEELPSKAIERSDLSQKVKSRLAQFPERHEEVIEMALYDGMTHEEISQVMDLPLGTVKTWIRRGLSKVKSELEANL